MKSKTLFSLFLLTLFTSLIPAMHAQTFSVIHTFTAGTDGAVPMAGVTIQGNSLYGTTSGPTSGTVYQLSHSGSNWLFSPLAALHNNGNPWARVVFGPDGHLYGTSTIGGMNNNGTVFKLTPEVGPCKDAACYWAVNDLHDFGSGTDGQYPEYGDLIWDQQGNIWDTTPEGGISGNGTVYELTPSGNGYTENVIYSFSGPDGAAPFGGLVFDNSGNLFGTTYGGGINNLGTVFELTYVVGVGWTEHVLYSFQNAGDGENPFGGLIFDSAGNLYGTTSFGGSGGGGTVFELSPSGDTWTFKLLYSLSFSGSGQCGPVAALTLDGAGNLYGTTQCDGPSTSGGIFKLSNTQNGWVYTSLHDFTGNADGRGPYSNVTIDSDGTLYGTTLGGGDDMYPCQQYTVGCGVVWMIKP
jgi:uncharacterized repeat protein (TIGR03803 family)